MNGVLVHLEGSVSIDKLLKIYEEQYEVLGWKVFERKVFEKIEEKIYGIVIDEIYWCKWKSEERGGYRIKFNEYTLKIEIDPKEEKVIKGIIDCAKKHNIGIEVDLKQG